ncbi:hypothetical protein cyc_05832 [Cyclospora cayetanensis]|uniref:Uncharacterized protein n=1 Tax=Cyclospora cayetanensis TaxID=88456 RepID=A0A1D3D4L1_9EIME|nr:hypothetical protein cyc_05832 [Cyclospora cayetanensis]
MRSRNSSSSVVAAAVGSEDSALMDTPSEEKALKALFRMNIDADLRHQCPRASKTDIHEASLTRLRMLEEVYRADRRAAFVPPRWEPPERSSPCDFFCTPFEGPPWQRSSDPSVLEAAGRCIQRTPCSSLPTCVEDGLPHTLPPHLALLKWVILSISASLFSRSSSSGSQITSLGKAGNPGGDREKQEPRGCSSWQLADDAE